MSDRKKKLSPTLQKEVLELENTRFSTKNACKEWPIEILRKGLNFI
jgi:hypothetical protein